MRRSPLALLTLGLAALLAITATAQPNREAAVEHPLDCAFYLTSKDSLGDTNGLSLTHSLFKVGGYDKALSASRLDNNFDPRGSGLIALALERYRAGDLESARQFADAGFEASGDDQEYSNRELAPIFKLFIALSDTQRIQKLFELGGEERRFSMLIALADAHAQLRNNAMARQIVDEAMRLPEPSLGSTHDAFALLAASHLYETLGFRKLSVSALDKLERFHQRPDSHHYLYDQLFARFYLLGLHKRAAENWERVEDNRSVSRRLFFSWVLTKAREQKSAEAILDGIKQPEFSRYPFGGDVVKQYLQLGRVAKAESVANRISAKPDSYDQQAGYMQIANHYIAAKNARDARRVLEKAFGKAKNIEFEHLPQHSIGASPGSRKSIFLSDISERFQKLGDLSRALDALRALNDDHRYARELLALSLAKFANDNARKLPTKQVVDLLKESLSIARKVDADEDEVQIMVHFAEALAKLRDRDGATDKLAELLESPSGRSNSGYALLLAGELFEKYKLAASDRLRTALTAILDEHDPL